MFLPDSPAAPQDAFIRALPKVELHVHLVGSASPETVLDLAARHPGSGVPVEAAALRAFYDFRDFAHFIEVHTAVNSLIRDAADITRLVTGLGDDLARQQVRYAEVTVTPYNHFLAGVSEDALLTGLAEGRARVRAAHGIDLRWCFDIPGEHGAEAGMVTARFALATRPDGLVSFGLGGPEAGVGRAQFAPAFTLAREAGLHSVPHAGETTGPATVWSALNDLGAERIGHGTNSVSDPALLAHLVEHRIPLEVCPTSNLCTRQVAAIEEHPVRRMIDAGVLVTLNTDDPPMFATSLNREYSLVARTFGLGTEEIAALSRNGVEASFLDAPGKQRILAEIDAVAAGAAS